MLFRSETDINDYLRFLETLKNRKKIETYEPIKKGNGKQVYKINNSHIVKILRSRGQDGNSRFSENYRFSLSKTGGNQLSKHGPHGPIDAVIMMLQNPNHFVCIPRPFLIESLFNKILLDNSNRQWQFQVSRVEKDNTLVLRCIRNKRNEQTIFDISNYENNLVFNNRKVKKPALISLDDLH